MTSTRSAVGWLNRVRRDAIAVDRQGTLLAATFLLVQVATVALTLWLHGLGANPQPPPEISGPNGEATAATGAVWVGAEVAIAIGLVGVIYVYKRSPEWIQSILKWNAIVGGTLWIGLDLGRGGMGNTFIVFALGAITVGMLADEFDLFWILNNVFALIIAVTAGAALALLFGVRPLLVAVILFSIYDHLFADRQTWMFSLAGLMLRLRLPVIFFYPKSLRFDWDAMLEEVEDEKHDDIMGIGMADLMLPASVAGAVAVASPMGVVAGVVVGTVIAAFRLRRKMLTQGSGAGMPALTAGVIGGYVIATAAVGLPTIL